MDGIKDPEGWTIENNSHPAPDYIRLYPEKDGTHWTDYMEYYATGKMICHACIIRSRYNSGNCRDGGEYFICVKNGEREKLRKKYEKKRDVQTKLI